MNAVKQTQEQYCMQTLQHVLTLEHELSVEHSHTLGQSTEHIHVQILVTQNTTQERKMYLRKKEKGKYMDNR